MRAFLILLVALAIPANAQTGIKAHEAAKPVHRHVQSGPASRLVDHKLSSHSWAILSSSPVSEGNSVEIEGITCFVGQGFDLPGSNIATIREGACSCCFHCSAEADCRAWVYNEATGICALKSRSFDPKERRPCPSCMASDTAGSRYFACERWRETVAGEATVSSEEVREMSKKTERTSKLKLDRSVDVFEAARRSRDVDAFLERTGFSVVSDDEAAREAGERSVLARYFGRSGWSKAEGRGACTVSVGYDQPHEFDFANMPVYAEEAFQCCDLCAHHKQCLSWVWHSRSGECYLKRSYNSRSARRTECDDCVAYSLDGEYSVHASSDEGGAEGETTHKHSTDFWHDARGRTYDIVRKEGSKTEPRGGSTALQNWRRCACSAGFDQPAEFDLLTRPLTLETATSCCGACSLNQRCVSWVWRSRSRECRLKGDYDAERNTMECDDCVSYSNTNTVQKA